MKTIFVLFLLAISATAQTRVIGASTAIYPGSPPGGIGGPCDAAALIGYLDASGNVITCVSSVWTITGGGGGAPSGPAGGVLGGTYPDPDYANVSTAGTTAQTVQSTTAPSAPVVTTHGTTGSTHYAYKVAFVFPQGISAASTATTITTGNATLNTSNYNVITAPACTGLAETVNIYMSTAGGNIPNTGLVANVACGATYNHQGADGSGHTIPSGDATSGYYTTRFSAGTPGSDLSAYARANSNILESLGVRYTYASQGTNLSGQLVVYDGTTDGTSAGAALNMYSFGTNAVDSTNGNAAANFLAYTTGAGNITGGTWAFGTFSQYDGSGTIGHLAGAEIFSNVKTGGTVTTNYGIRVHSQAGVGTSNYGIGIDDQGATNAAIHTGSGKIDFGDRVNSTAFLASGTTFTASGCSNGTLVGGATAGKFTSGDAGGSCSIVITMGSSMASTTGWSCQIQDLSAPSKVWGQTASDTTTATFLSPGVTTSTNVVSFFCLGY